MSFKWFYLVRRNPSITEEDWPRAWRAHAVFASQFPVVGARITNLAYCSRLYKPTLNGAAVDPPSVTHDYDGVGVVACGSRLSTGDDLPPEMNAKIFEDERRAFANITPTCSFHAKETFVQGGAPGQAAVIRFLGRKAGATSDAFLEHLNGAHARIGARVADATKAVRYVHNAITEPPPPGYPFDAITEMWFASPEEATRSLAEGAQEAVARDIGTFCDPARVVTILTTVIHRWPKR